MCAWQHSAVSHPSISFSKKINFFPELWKKKYSISLIFLWPDSLYTTLKLNPYRKIFPTIYNMPALVSIYVLTTKMSRHHSFHTILIPFVLLLLLKIRSREFLPLATTRVLTVSSLDRFTFPEGNKGLACPLFVTQVKIFTYKFKMCKRRRRISPLTVSKAFSKSTKIIIPGNSYCFENLLTSKIILSWMSLCMNLSFK